LNVVEGVCAAFEFPADVADPGVGADKAIGLGGVVGPVDPDAPDAPAAPFDRNPVVPEAPNAAPAGVTGNDFVKIVLG